MAKNNRGVTIIELSVAIAISSILVAVITAYITQSQKLSLRALHAQEIGSLKINALNWIMRDLRASSVTSLGNLVLNGDFETTTNTETYPEYWWTTGALPYIYDDSTSTVHVGYRSIQLTSAYSNYWNHKPITFTPGTAYLISAWYRTSDPATKAQLGLASTDHSTSYLPSPNTEAQGNSLAWSKIEFRWPPQVPNLYANGGVLNNQVVVALSRVAGGTGDVYFDDISVTPLQSVLVSTTASEVNVNSTAANMSDVNDNVGFRFVRFEDNVSVIYRYRVTTTGGTNSLLREKYDPASSLWISDGPSRLGLGLSAFKFSFNDANLVPTDGKNTPIQITMDIQTALTKRENLPTRIETVMVYPVTP